MINSIHMMKTGSFYWDLVQNFVFWLFVTFTEQMKQKFVLFLLVKQLKMKENNMGVSYEKRI